MEKQCEYCQTPFEAKRPDKLYCSDSCRQMAYIGRRITPPFKKVSNDGLELSKNQIEPSIDVLSETGEASIKTNEKSKTSIDSLLEDFNRQEEKEYIPYTSTCVDNLIELTNERDYLSKLSFLMLPEGKGIMYWVSLRYKCLIECLLTFSEMKQIEIDDLKEICNAFTMLTKSKNFKSLPDKYPFINDIINLRENLKKICLSENTMEYLKYRLSAATKKTLMATRWELSYFVPKVSFSRLNFNE